MTKLSINNIYKELINHYGEQGWWPLLDLGYLDKNPTSSGNLKNYHPGEYSVPKTDKQRIEIFIGALLVQHTSWANVEKALLTLEEKDCINIDNLNSMPRDDLAILIKPTRYFNQKADYLKNLANYLSLISFTELDSFSTESLREELLRVKGIGEETADNLLVYVFKRPQFIVDFYSRVFFERIGLFSLKEKNTVIKNTIQMELPDKHQIYNEFHALLVEHGKKHCKPKKPLCIGCPFDMECLKKGVGSS